MEDQICPRCKTSKYTCPSLKLLVNVCGHTLCESCVELLFMRGSGSCHVCGIPLRRNNFRLQLFEDLSVEKEVDIRRRLMQDYNKREEDFATLEEYNDYLEEIETIVHNLCNNIDIINTNKRIESYKRENREIIQRNKLRKGREENELDNLISWERAQTEMRRKELEALEMEKQQTKTREMVAFIDKLMSSKQDAKEIVNEFAERAEKLKEDEKKIPPAAKASSQFSTGIKFAHNSNKMYLPVPKAEEGPLYAYEPIVFLTDGPIEYTINDIETKGFIKHIRAETQAAYAGGYRASSGCLRALQEAMRGLYNGIK